jgi:hypothetical protein
MGQDNTQLPITKVVYVVSDPTPECLESIKLQSYEDTGLIYKDGVHSPILFNKAIADIQNTLLFGFITGDTVLEKSATQKVVDKITLFKNQEIGAMYGDFELESGVPSYQQSYSRNLIKKNVLNPNIYINGKIKTPLFNQELNHLYFYDALIKISGSAIIYHIPEILYKTKNTQQDISSDLKRLGINVNS